MKYFHVYLMIFLVSCSMKNESTNMSALESQMLDSPKIEKNKNKETKARYESSETKKMKEKMDVLNVKESSIYPIGFLDGKKNPDTNLDIIIPIYNAPNGDSIGQMRLYYHNRAGSSNYSILPDKDDYKELFRSIKPDYFQTGYQGTDIFLNYYSLKENYVQVLSNTEKSNWISLKDIEKYLLPTTFAQDIGKAKTWQLYGYTNKLLRKEGRKDSKVLLKLDESKHVIKEFTKVEGNWGYAIVEEVKEILEGCYTNEELKQVITDNSFEGWIQIVDDNGQVGKLNYARSC